MPIFPVSLLTSIFRFALGGLILVLMAWSLGACRSEDTSTASGVPELVNTLPSSWTPIMFGGGGLFRQGSPWLTINIDGDGESEYLLFYSYDNGQVGAVIYDQQVGSTTATNPTPAPAPNQPTGTYMPYGIEPSYWVGSGSVGYVAPPGATSAELNYAQVERLNPSDPGAAPTGVNNELYVIGSNKVLTVVWWQSEYNGYGVAQVGASFGLVNPVYVQNDSARPIATITGLDQVGGTLARSLICRVTLYERGSAVEAPGVVDPHEPAVQYTGLDRGLGFCLMPPPAYPFYPEGVVLGYLKPEDRSNPEQTPEDMAAYRAQFVSSDVTEEQRQQFLSLIDLNGTSDDMLLPLVVQGLVAPATVPAAPEQRLASDASITTRVCAQVASATLDDNRRLLFELVHAPPTLETVAATPVATTDRWYIANVLDVSHVGTSCSAVIVEMGAGSP